MKRLTLNLLLVAFCLPLFPQNAQFVPFGQSKEAVLAFLKSRDYIVRIDTEAKDEVCAVGKNYFLKYRFKNDKLYEISTNKYYAKSKMARPRVQNALGYFNLCKGNVIKTGGLKGEQNWVSIHEDRLMELRAISYGDFMKIELVATSRFFGPRKDTEERIVAFSYDH
jgi:hypothetical protein